MYFFYMHSSQDLFDYTWMPRHDDLPMMVSQIVQGIWQSLDTPTGVLT